MKIIFLRWLIRIATKDTFILARREWLENIAKDLATRKDIPEGKLKIPILKLLRIDGSDIVTAMDKYNSMKESI